MCKCKTSFRLLIIIALTFCFTGCSHSNKLTVAFTRITSLDRGSEVRTAGLPIGYVTDFRPNKNVDTIFAIIKINHKIRVPKGSQFYLDENPLGTAIIDIVFSDNKTYLNSKDVSRGIFRTIKEKYPLQYDTSMIQFKFLSPPKIDTSKNN